MKIHVKNINADYQKLFDMLCKLQRVFITNKDTHTFYNCDEWLETQLEVIKEYFKINNQTIIIIKGGL